MTLRRQILAVISLVFLGILAGLLVFSVRGTRDYLEQQLASHAQDAATALSLPLAQSMGRDDMVLVELNVASVFDRGFFKRIVVTDAKGKVLVERELPEKVAEVPQWFTRAFPLASPGGEAFVSSGWRQLGKVIVQSQPEYAYQYLWKSAREVALWVFLAYLVALFLSHLLLQIILNPLYAIERSARAIQERRFEQIVTQPAARELARVVRAMNDMARRIAEILDAETAKVEGFRKQVLHDELTGLDNRRSFDLHLGELLSGPEPHIHGVLVGLELNGLKDLNTGGGYLRGNALLQSVARISAEVLQGHARISARLSGASFGFVLVDVGFEEGRHLAHQLLAGLHEVLADVEDAGVSCSVGAVPFNPGEQKSHLMARLDLAIEAARQQGRNSVFASNHLGTDLDALGSERWRALIQHALNDNRWRLLAQPVVFLDDRRLLHQELMVRLLDEHNGLVPAASFVPMAMRHKLMPEVDRAVVLLAVARLRGHGAPAMPMAINVSLQSVRQRSFVDWLRGVLREQGQQAKLLSFELTCFGCSQDIEAARAFASMVREQGARFGIDRLGLDALSTRVLRQVPPDYVKLDSALIHEVEGEEVSGDWVNAIAALARSMDVQIVAQGIESEMDAQRLVGIYDAGQGYFFGKPEPV
ncbi:MAG: EAL domain-containing protein [Curvibacter lanceolatus]|uniref:EAL domain-containing protein n=1 Tax=Curvibacter lanceolatus TaxID=86182 RepID=UPI000381052F|nr:EAL domain-containing protein [Curvibacter lanceolatus]MBV5295217.1 EAL domain-containing protein [Curvibacter lanceolatus]